MSDRHDLRRQTKEIQDALSRYEREQLIDILVHVFRTYVLEGASLAAAPVASSTGDDFAGLSFAQVIERLQLRLELPELQLFEVQGGRVQVRVDGRLQPLELPAARNDGASHLQVAVTPAGAPPAAAPTPRAPGVEVREVVIPPSAVPPQAPAQASSSRPDPRPGAVRATSAASSARPAASPAATPAPATGGTAASPPPAAPAAPAKPERAPEPTGTSGGGRFGLLEID